MYFLIAIFIISGSIVALLIGAKYMADRRNKSFVILDIISRGDIRVRALSHEVTHHYPELKDKAYFLVTKQLPMRAKNWFNKSRDLLKEQTEKHVGNVRNSRLLKKPDGLSEYFKNMSSIEKGNGSIEETFEDGFEEENKVD